MKKVLMMTTEADVREILLKAWANQVLIERIENSVTVGSADLNCVDISSGNEFWIELKIIGNKSRSSTVKVYDGVYLRPAQYAWHGKRYVAKSKAFVLAASRNLDMVVLLRYAFRPNQNTDFQELAYIRPSKISDIGFTKQVLGVINRCF